MAASLLSTAVAGRYSGRKGPLHRAALAGRPPSSFARALSAQHERPSSGYFSRLSCTGLAADRCGGS
jgi:hypothetical protein